MKKPVDLPLLVLTQKLWRTLMKDVEAMQSTSL
jgi:hypothetical protein